jgi:ATP-dependent helicase/nuclease subunit A
VGDPKQSIYRFRRADIAQYLRAADQIGADAVGLVTNFRSTSAMIGFTNAVFARLIDEEADVQPRFNPLSAGRRDALLHHGSVHVVGAESHADLAASREAGRADELRRREAADVVDAIRRAIVDGWRVADDRSDGTRPCTLGDICVLVPTRLSLPALESQLRAAGLAYRAENASIVYSSDEVRSVLMALRAADDPTDELAVVTALRSPLYGCSDVDLYTWRSGGGTWSVWRTPPDGLAGHPVADALAHLDSVRDRIGSHGAAELLSAVIDERRVWDAALDAGDARDVWHRLRFVVDQARAWADAGGHGVRRYLAWARMQATDGRVSEAILPEEDRDTIRIMTIHAAKGLEFPIAIVSGLTTQPQKRTGVSVVWKGSDWFLSGKGDDGSFEEHRPLDEQMGDAERRRLLYVACTRAADHLVVSLHRIRDHGTLAAISPDKMTSAELLAFVGDAGDAAGPLDAPRTAVAPIPPGHTVVDSLPERIAGDTGEETTDDAAHDTGSDIAPDIAERWVTRHRAVVRAAARRRSIAATRLAEEVAAQAARDAVDDPGLDKHPVDIETPAWQRGRYGTSIGRAVHGTLQFCDLVGGADIGTLARSQCAAEGIIGLESQVVALATSAIAAPIVRIAAGGAPHWRELFVVAPVADRVLEGYIDLLVETGDGLVIVDYKTDRWSGPKQSAERIGRYRLQLAAYAVALAGIVDQPIVGGTLVRCVAGREPDQVEIPDWAAALAEVRALVR